MSNIPSTPNDYVAFDATNISDLIINRLNQGQVFTDQNYQGSNMSAIIDIISYSFSTLLFYLNKTASESLFSEAQVYENMNRIVKLLNYNPLGRITQNVPYTLNSSSSLPAGNYIIPRYSYIKVGADTYSFNTDIAFTNSANGVIELQNVNSDFFLYQGQFQEYPIYSAQGINNEILYISLGSDTYVDHFNLFVYVKDVNTGLWTQWKQTPNLFLNKSTDKNYEIRFNANKNYEIKFGDNINGSALNDGDKVLVYYLNINPNATALAANTLNKLPIALYNSVNYNQILNNTISNPTYIIPQNYLKYVTINNDYPSNPYSEEESVDSIRNNAPKNFSFQQRLVTANDFQSYINSNYAHLFANSSVVNNDDYLSGHIKYLYNIGIDSPQSDNNILYSQIKFANSCNFNNVYVYLVPKNSTQQYVAASQKEFIISELQEKKVLTSEVVIIDPVYMALDFYAKSPYSKPSTNDINNSKLLIYKQSHSRRSPAGIQADVIALIKKTFNNQTSTLGQMIDLHKLTNDILNIDGVDHIQTYRSDTDSYAEGISLLVWNNSYPQLDVYTTSQNIQLQYFQFPVFNNINNLINRIQIVDNSGVIQVSDY